jgi:tetratricopeptide (TPR) repeat protein
MAENQTAHGSAIAQAYGPGAAATVHIGLTAAEVRDLALEITSNESAALARVEALGRELALTKEAVIGLLKIVNASEVPIDEWPQTLARIAQRHRELEERLGALTPDDPAAKAIIEEARAVIAQADSKAAYDHADRLLGMAETADLNAIREAEALEQEARAAAFSRRLEAGATRAERGELSLLRLNYSDAAQHFKVASEIVPAQELTLRAKYLDRCGTSLMEAGNYTSAIEPLRRALELTEQALGADHANLALLLNDLALAYRAAGRYSDAEPLYRRALNISEHAYGAEHPEVAQILNNLAGLYHYGGRYADAEPLYWRTLRIWEKTIGLENAYAGLLLNNMAELCRDTGRYADAEPLYRHALRIVERAFGQNHPRAATILGNLGLLYWKTGRYSEAENLYLQSLKILEKALGPTHPDVALGLNNLGALYRDAGNYTQAETLHRRALKIRQTVLGPEHPAVAASLCNLAAVCSVLGKYAEAKTLYARSLTIFESNLGSHHPNTVAVRTAQADFLRRSGGLCGKLSRLIHPRT